MSVIDNTSDVGVTTEVMGITTHHITLQLPFQILFSE